MKPELAEGPILIRPYRADDIEPAFEAVRESLDELSRWLPWPHADYAIEETREFILAQAESWENKTEYAFGVFDSTNCQFLGGVGLNQINRTHRVGNLGYWVRGSATGRGVATTAVRLAARFGFEQLRLSRIEILAALGNLASQRVAERAGATREGVLRRRLLIHGHSQDAVIFSLIPQDLGIALDGGPFAKRE